MSDLTKRLRNDWTMSKYAGALDLYTAMIDAMREAADEIERLEREVSRLRQELGQPLAAERERDAEFEVAERLRVENYELRELLKEALRCMKEAKLRWAPTTTNSAADVCIARIDAKVKP